MQPATLPLSITSAIVIDGARGTVMALATADADILIADVLEDDMRAIQEAVRSPDRKSMVRCVDVTDATQVQVMVDQSVTELGVLDVIVNSADVIKTHLVADLSESGWDFVMDVNANHTFSGCKAALGPMRARQSDRIINAASIAGKQGFPNLAHYSASKFAALGFTNALAKEVAQVGITVNAICPCIGRTYMWDRLADEWKNDEESVDDSWVRHQFTLIAQGRAKTPQNMGRLTLLFATVENVTGLSVNVVGGFTFH